MDELDSLFDSSPRPRAEPSSGGVRLRGSFKVKEPVATPPETVDARPFPRKDLAEPSSGDLEVDVRERARQAAKAHDEFSAAKAAYDQERSRLQKEMDSQLVSLKARVVEAREREGEARSALNTAMSKERVTRIPMKDRPDIYVKNKKGAKSGITRTWLMDPEGVAIKGFNKALAGESEFVSGEEFAKRIWETQPKSADKSEVIIPDPYEDEPDHG